MSRYDTYTRFDDRKLEEQEIGFKGFNDRLRPDQIASGLLQKSENARLDLNGQWQSRKGVQNRLSPFAVSGTSLRLPTEGEITAGTIMLLPHTITNATASSGTITLTTAQAHNLSVGDTIEVNDIVSDGDDVNGSQTLIAGTTGSTLKYTVGSSSPTLTVTEGSNLVNSVPSTYSETTVTDSDGSGGTVGRSGTTLTITFDQNVATAFGLKAGTPITVSGVTGGGTASGTGSSNPSNKVNGDHFITSLTDNGGVTNGIINITISDLDASVSGTVVVKTDKGLFSFTPQELTTGTPPKFLPCAGAVILNDSAVSEVTCACKFSDPNETTDEEFILLASNAKVVAFNTSTLESFDIPLKSGETIPLDSSIIQVFNKVIIFRGGQISLENDKFFSPLTISAASSSGTTRTITTFGNHGLQTGDSVDISGVTATETYIGQYQITRTGDTTFTYTATGSGSSSTTLSDAKVSPTFFLVPNGVFTQPLQINTSAKDCAFINDIFTFHTSQSFIVGQKIICTVNTNSGLQESKASGDVDRASFIINKVFTDSAAVGGGASSSPGLVRVGTTVTVTTASSHGLEINQPITIASSGTSEFNGNNVVASVPSASSFTIELASAAGSDDTTGSATITPQAGVSFLVKENNINNIKTQAEVRAASPSFTKKVSEGLGFTHSPAPNFGAYHNKRLVVPYNFEITGTTGSSVITDRNIKDEVLISDILDSDTFDQIFSQFRFNAGGADFVVGFQSFANDQLIIFNRNSIHTVNNTVNLVSSTVKQVTDEVGCIARGSIEQIGSEILFLSDNGVYGISFVDEYNLRGTALPLSESINKTIQRINKAHADKAVSAYFDNRYYLAVALDNAIENNAVIIYNFLNKQWESVDTFGDTNTTFDILDLIVAGKGTNRAVYAINKQGGIHQLDVNENGQDAIISTLGATTATAVEVDAKARTRQFTIGSIDRKKWNDFEIHAESGVTFPTDFSIVANTENIDEENISLNSLKSLNGGVNLAAEEDVAIRGRIGNKRAYGLDIEITRVTGRPKLRAVKVSGVETFRSTNRAE
jgi:hypothetical protein